MSQNILLSGVPDDQVDELLKAPVLQRLTPQPKHFMSRTVSCTGNEFCNLAIVETKKRAIDVAEYLDQHVQLDEKVRIHFIGCPNSCGQKHIADIGLQGSLLKTPEAWLTRSTSLSAGHLEQMPSSTRHSKAACVAIRLVLYWQSLFCFTKKIGLLAKAFMRMYSV